MKWLVLVQNEAHKTSLKLSFVLLRTSSRFIEVNHFHHNNYEEKKLQFTGIFKSTRKTDKIIKAGTFVG